MCHHYYRRETQTFQLRHLLPGVGIGRSTYETNLQYAAIAILDEQNILDLVSHEKAMRHPVESGADPRRVPGRGDKTYVELVKRRPAHRERIIGLGRRRSTGRLAEIAVRPCGLLKRRWSCKGYSSYCCLVK